MAAPSSPSLLYSPFFSPCIALPIFEPSLARSLSVRGAIRLRAEFVSPFLFFQAEFGFIFSPPIFHIVLLISSENCGFSLILVIQTMKMHLFRKIIREKFCQSGKKYYLCTRFRKNGCKTPVGREHKTRVLWQDLHKQEVVVQEASERSLG